MSRHKISSAAITPTPTPTAPPAGGSSGEGLSSRAQLPKTHYPYPYPYPHNPMPSTHAHPMMKEPTWGVKAAYGRVTPHLGSFCSLYRHVSRFRKI